MNEAGMGNPEQEKIANGGENPSKAEIVPVNGSGAEVAATPAVAEQQSSTTTEGDPTEDALFEVAGRFSADANEPAAFPPTPEQPAASVTPPAEVSDYLQKVKKPTDFTKGSDSQGWTDADVTKPGEQPSTYLDNSIVNAKVDIGESPKDANADKTEMVNATEKGFGETGIYAMSGVELRRQLREIPGIGPKLTERIAGTLEDFKELRATLPEADRNQQHPMESAADLMVIPQVGLKRSNAIAEKFGLEPAVKVEPAEADDYEFDEENEDSVQFKGIGFAMESNGNGFKPEDEAEWNGNVRKNGEQDKNSSDWDNGGDAEYGHLPEHHQQDTIKSRIESTFAENATMTMQDLLKKMGMTEEEAREKVRAAMNAGNDAEAQRVADMYAKQKAEEMLNQAKAERNGQQPGEQEEPYVAPKTIDLPKDQYTVGEGMPIIDNPPVAPVPETQEKKSIFDRFKEALSKVKLSEGKKRVLQRVALAAASLTTAVLLNYSIDQQAPKTTQTMDTFADYVQRTQVPDTIQAAPPSVEQMQQQFSDSNPELNPNPVAQEAAQTASRSWVDRLLNRDSQQENRQVTASPPLPASEVGPTMSPTGDVENAPSDLPPAPAGVGIPRNSMGNPGYLNVTPPGAEAATPQFEQAEKPAAEQAKQSGAEAISQPQATENAETSQIDKDSLWNEIEVVVRNAGMEPDNASTDVVKDLIKGVNNGKVDFSQDVSDKQFSVLQNSSELGSPLPGADGQTFDDDAIVRMVKLVKDMNAGVDLPADASEEIQSIIKRLSSGELFSEDMTQEEVRKLSQYALNELAQ